MKKNDCQSQEPTNLEGWLALDATDEYFGPTSALKIDVLATLLTGGNLSALARRHGVAKQSVHQHATRARELYGLPKKSGGKLTPRQ